MESQQQVPPGIVAFLSPHYEKVIRINSNWGSYEEWATKWLNEKDPEYKPTIHTISVENKEYSVGDECNFGVSGRHIIKAFHWVNDQWEIEDTTCGKIRTTRNLSKPLTPPSLDRSGSQLGKNSFGRAMEEIHKSGLFNDYNMIDAWNAGHYDASNGPNSEDPKAWLESYNPQPPQPGNRTEREMLALVSPTYGEDSTKANSNKEVFVRADSALTAMRYFAQQEVDKIKNEMNARINWHESQSNHQRSEPGEQFTGRSEHLKQLWEYAAENERLKAELAALKTATEEEVLNRQIQEKDKLIEVQDEYIKFLGKEIGDNAIYMHIHGMDASEETVQKGIDFRAKIEEYKKAKQ